MAHTTRVPDSCGSLVRAGLRAKRVAFHPRIFTEATSGAYLFRVAATRSAGLLLPPNFAVGTGPLDTVAGINFRKTINRVGSPRTISAYSSDIRLVVL